MKPVTKHLFIVSAVLFVSILLLIFVSFLPAKQVEIVTLPTLTPTPTALVQKIENPDISPTIAANKIKILDTSSWTTHSCGQIKFKVPPSGYKTACNLDSQTRYNVVITADGEFLPSATIAVDQYDGGSRRQYWINKLSASPNEVAKYMRFQESVFGSVSGLDVFASGGWWQGGYSSPILVVKGKTIVAINGGRDFNDQTGKITRWDFTDTIASTIRFTP